MEVKIEKPKPKIPKEENQQEKKNASNLFDNAGYVKFREDKQLKDQLLSLKQTEKKLELTANKI